MKHQNDELSNTLTQFIGFIVAPTDSDWIRHLRDFGTPSTILVNQTHDCLGTDGLVEMHPLHRTS